MMETGAIIYEKVYASPQTFPKISFQDKWVKELDSEVAGCIEDSQQTQPKIKKPICVSTGRRVKSEQPSGSHTQAAEQPFGSSVLLGFESTKKKNRETCFQMCASVCWTFW